MKMHLTMKPNFMSSIDNNKKCAMYCKGNSNMVMVGNDTDETIKELFGSLLQKYQIGLEQFMRGSNFAFDYVSGIHYICSKHHPWWIIGS